jgi:hypothetical protein
MMKYKKNEKGFALVLSLVMLMAMSLLGGSLIVISSGDHRSNNTSDDYQQAFYVAETALIEGEKLIKNVRMGPWVDVEVYVASPDTDTSDPAWDDIVEQMRNKAISNAGYARNIDRREYPQNKEDDLSGLNKETPCFKSFRNISRADIQVYKHYKNGNFGSLISAIFDDPDIDSLARAEELDREEERMDKFRFEYFIVNIGSASFKGEGSSVAKASTNTKGGGVAYKIYGCGMMMPDRDSVYINADKTINTTPDILIPLEATLVIG